jgi:hypothetical protein
MSQQIASLAGAFGATAAQAIGGGNILANLGVIANLPDAEREAARGAITQSLKAMWIMVSASRLQHEMGPRQGFALISG